MPQVAWLLGAIFAPLVTGLATLLLPRPSIALRTVLALLGPVAAVGLLAGYLVQYGLNTPVPVIPWMPELHLDIALRADQHGVFFALLVAGIGILITLYARAYFGPVRDDLYRFFPSLHLFMTAMLGVALSDNLFLLLMFWELTSISSFLLIGWEREDKVAVKNALQAFMVTGIGGLAMTGGLIIIGAAGGSWTFSELIANGIDPSPIVMAGFALTFAGAAAKSAQWPLHFWLPGAMAAPTPVSAYLHSATMVKAGVYLVGRLFPLFAANAALTGPAVVATIGGITMLLGAYVALRRSDLKQIFAYTTVSQLGLLMCMYGIGTIPYHGQPNVIWDITQILNHAMYKAPLFILAGAVAHVVHTRELPALRGLFRCRGQKRIMALGLILAAYALAAGPLTVSFIAKEFFYYGIYHGLAITGHWAFYLLMGAAILTGAFNTAIFIRMTRVLLGQCEDSSPLAEQAPSPHQPAAYIAHHDQPVDESPSHEDVDLDPHDRGWFWPSMLWVPALVIVAMQYIGGIIPGAYEAVFGGIERSFNYIPAGEMPMAWSVSLGTPLYMSLAGYALGIAIGFAPIFTTIIRDVHDGIFPAFYNLFVRGGARVFAIFQTGNLRHYIALTFGAMVALVIWIASRVPDYFTLPENLGLVDERLIPGYLVTLLMCFAAVCMPLVRHRAARVLVLGVAGTAATAIYYVYSAPDLALTQISIEVVSLVMFLLVLTLLPDERVPQHGRWIMRSVLGLSVGGMMFWLALMAGTAAQPPRVATAGDGEPIANLGEYFLRGSTYGVDTIGLSPDSVFGGVVDRGIEHVTSFGTHPPMPVDLPEDAVFLHKGGGGNNVVNVILVDFRGFDTMGEITVLSLAALGVWTLLRRPRAANGDQAAPAPVNFRMPIDARVSTLVLRQGVKLLVPLALVFSGFIFFKGHQTPGGGFVGGLVASVALVVYRKTFGSAALRRLLPVPERALIAIGLALALGTGIVALLAGLPFMTSNNGYLPLPGGAKFHWATVMFFDAGVFLVVVGVTIGMIDALSREIERQR